MEKRLLNIQLPKVVLQLFSIFLISGCASNSRESKNLENISHYQKRNSADAINDSTRKRRQYLYEYDSDTGTYRTLLISNHGIHGLLAEYPGGISFDDSLAKIGTKYISICEEAIAKGFASGTPKILFENYNDKVYVKENIKKYTRKYCIEEENREIIIDIQAGLVSSSEVMARLKPNRNKHTCPGWAYGGGTNYWSTGCEINKSDNAIKIWPFQVNAPE